MNPKSNIGFFALMFGLVVVIIALFSVSKMFGALPNKDTSSLSPTVAVDTSDWKNIQNPVTGIKALCAPQAFLTEGNDISCVKAEDNSELLITTGESVTKEDFFETARMTAQGFGAVGGELQIDGKLVGRSWNAATRAEAFTTKNGYDAAIFQFDQTVTTESDKTTTTKSPLVFVMRTPINNGPSNITFIFFQKEWDDTTNISNEETIMRTVVDSIIAPGEKAK